MAIAPTLLKYLADQQVTYEVISHERTTTSLGTVNETWARVALDDVCIS